MIAVVSVIALLIDEKLRRIRKDRAYAEVCHDLYCTGIRNSEGTSRIAHDRRMDGRHAVSIIDEHILISFALAFCCGTGVHIESGIPRAFADGKVYHVLDRLVRLIVIDKGETVDFIVAEQYLIECVRCLKHFGHRNSRCRKGG